MHTLVKISALGLILALAACGSEDDSKDKAENTPQAETSAEEQKADTAMSDTDTNPNQAFLDENKTKDGVTVTESGLQYRVINKGDGATPAISDTVKVHYAGRLIDGTEFDSSYKRGEPIEFPTNGVIPGWVEALQLMQVGDKWELVIPSDLAYGDAGAGADIPPGATLVFEVELLGVTDNSAREAARETAEAERAEAAAEFTKTQDAFLAENAKADGVTVTESGLQFKVITAGDGATPTKDDFVEVHYAGRLINGTEFDSSYARGETNIFPAGRLIKGWTEALTMMKAGAKWQLVIPSDLAYGDRGAGADIPPGAALIFDMELFGIKTEAEAEAAEKAARDAQIAELKDGQAEYLEKNATADGVTVTESGLQYKVVTEGEGENPTAASTVTVHYSGTLINGEQFDSSYARGTPASFPLNGVIAGWTEGLQLMKPGATYEFTIPFFLGYGERGSRTIPPYATLIFTVELISIDS